MIQSQLPNSATALSIRDLHKVYRLYNKPVHKFLDVFGLCPPGSYREHPAVDGISLDINRGEKVALIGRNGAGKSTLLKMITGSLRPTSGSLEVNGRVSALLQIGTGFHPDFTGRQNVFAGFAHMGVTGRQADDLFDRVVDFAELEEYIDQPMKTYSTGMAARLMFSAATVLVPDILIVDEVLGVGDSYFSHKSYEHMRQMCSSNETTLLLVTHDLYSAMNICDRFIWIDRGQVKKDGGPKETLDSYENSIKAQEEARLRARNQQALIDRDASYTGVTLWIGSRNGFALDAPLALQKIALEYPDGSLVEMDVASGQENWSLFPEGNLGPATQVGGRSCRTLAAHGSIFHKAEWSIALPKAEALSAVRVDYLYGGQDRVDFKLHTVDNRRLLKGSFEPSDGWRQERWSIVEQSVDVEVSPLESVGRPSDDRMSESTGGGAESVESEGVPVAETAEATSLQESESHGQYGTGEVRIEKVDFQDRDGKSVVRISHGQPLTVEVDLSVSPDLSSREVTFVVTFHKSGVSIGAHSHWDRLELAEGSRVRVRAEFDPFLLGGGEWLVSLAFGQPDLYRESFNPYFALNDRWYHLITRGHTLQVESTTSIDKYSLFLHPAKVQSADVSGGGRVVVE